MSILVVGAGVAWSPDSQANALTKLLRLNRCQTAEVVPAALAPATAPVVATKPAPRYEAVALDGVKEAIGARSPSGGALTDIAAQATPLTSSEIGELFARPASQWNIARGRMDRPPAETPVEILTFNPDGALVKVEGTYTSGSGESFGLRPPGGTYTKVPMEETVAVFHQAHPKTQLNVRPEHLTAGKADDILAEVGSFDVTVDMPIVRTVRANGSGPAAQLPRLQTTQEVRVNWLSDGERLYLDGKVVRQDRGQLILRTSHGDITVDGEIALDTKWGRPTVLQVGPPAEGVPASAEIRGQAVAFDPEVHAKIVGGSDFSEAMYKARYDGFENLTKQPGQDIFLGGSTDAGHYVLTGELLGFTGLGYIVKLPPSSKAAGTVVHVQRTGLHVEEVRPTVPAPPPR
jgi:hypothetical protein